MVGVLTNSAKRLSLTREMAQDNECVVQLIHASRYETLAVELTGDSHSYAATRIFVSANAPVVQRFMEIVILDRVREDIHENKKLNVHLFNSLKRALYKPAGFFKGTLDPIVPMGQTVTKKQRAGFLFPLAASGMCKIRC
jgi:hypothetical protein